MHQQGVAIIIRQHMIIIRQHIHIDIFSNIHDNKQQTVPPLKMNRLISLIKIKGIAQIATGQMKKIE
jgi:hypothetical protein